MLAAVFHGRGDLRVAERPQPPPPPAGWVQVAVGWCGICGTDLDELLRGPVLVPVAPHPLTGAQVPLVLRSEEHTSELQSQSNLVCRLLLEKKKRSNKALPQIKPSEIQEQMI